MTPIRIAICDNNQLFRDGISSLLQSASFTVVAAARSLSEVLAAAASQTDIVIWGLDDEDDLQDQLDAQDSPSGDKPRLVVLASAPSNGLSRTASLCGVRALLSKDISGTVLQRALELVMLGQRLFPAPGADAGSPRCAEPIPIGRYSQMLVADQPGPRLRLAVPGPRDDVQLSEREEQILRCLIDGAPNKTIARGLAITDATVKVHIKGLLRKLRVNNRTQAAIWGVNNGYTGGSSRRAIVPLHVEAEPLLRAVP